MSSWVTPRRTRRQHASRTARLVILKVGLSVVFNNLFQADPSCLYFTYFQDTTVCSMYQTCPISDNSCHDCFSGDVSCSYECDRQGNYSIEKACVNFMSHFPPLGFCDGSSVAIDVTSTREDCITECKDNQFCEWWSFDNRDGFCTLLSSCTALDLSCATCISGQKQCSAEGPTEPPPPPPNGI